MNEPITDRRFKDICVQGFEYKDIKMMMYLDPTLDIDQMQSTMRYLYLDDLSPTATLQDRCSWRSHDCGIDLQSLRKQGHYARNCWKRKDDNDSKSTGAHNQQKNKESSNGKAASNVGAEHKWCSVHKTTSHDDTACYKQGAPRPPQSGRAHTASAVQGASTRPTDDEKTAPQIRRSFRRGIRVYRAASW